MLVELLAAFSVGIMVPLPPVEYRQDKVIAEIGFTTPAQVDTYCGGVKGDSLTIYGCAYEETGRIIMPHPCTIPNESYARLLCHELGHISGWPGDHPNPEEYKVPQISPRTSPKK
jgi:hypothetical protein